jgi:hypothetical protein
MDSSVSMIFIGKTMSKMSDLRHVGDLVPNDNCLPLLIRVDRT